MASTDPVVFDVARDCQQLALSALPGSETADVAERAVDLALRRRDTTADVDAPTAEHAHVLGDVLANARFIVRRSHARHLRLVESAGVHAVIGQPTGGSRGFVDRETPESRVLARELIETLAAKAATLGPTAQRVLAGLIAGETTRQTAAATGVSESTVGRVQRRLRACAADAGYRTAA